ncbi:MAG: LysR family transcriptional regulator [Burkholderiaceae bacterium]
MGRPISTAFCGVQAIVAKNPQTALRHPPPLNPQRVDFLSLRLLLAVAQTGSITRAADQCHLALAAASARLKELEERLNVQLLERYARGARLTQAGELVVIRARAIERELSQMTLELEDHRQAVTGHIRVVANMSSIAAVLPQDLTDFLKSHPGVRIDLSEHTSREIQSLVSEGRADIGVLTSVEFRTGLQAHDYYVDEVVATVPTRAPWIRIKTMTPQMLLDQELIILQEGGAISEWLYDLARMYGQSLKVRVKAKGFDALAQLVSAGLGVTVLPKVVAARFSRLLKLKTLPITGVDSRRTISICTIAGGAASPAARDLYEFLRQRH